MNTAPQESDVSTGSSTSAALAAFGLAALSLVVVGCAHVAIGYGLYYCRRLGISDVFLSDVLVFLLPAAWAFGANLCLMLHALRAVADGKRIVISATVAIVAVFVSLSASLLVAFNALGT